MTDYFSFSPLIVGTMRLGAWGVNMDQAALTQFIEDCLALGLRDFDHADIYGHYTEEARFGAVLKQNPSLRQQMQLTTKCGIQLVCPQRPSHHIKSYNLTKAHIIASAEASLQALHTDYLDLFLLHRPDVLMNPHDIAEAFRLLAESGKVRHFGVSNFSTTQVEMLATFTPLVNHQVEISALKLDAFTDGTLDKCFQYQIRPTAWSPLGGGELFAPITDPRTDRLQQVVHALCERYAATADQILLAWLMKHPLGIVPVMGTSKTARLRSALSAKDIALSHEDWYRIWEASTGEEVA